MNARVLIAMLALVTVLLSVACAKPVDEPNRLIFMPGTMDFSFDDSDGNRVYYDSAENTLIVEPDINLDELAEAFCRAERDTGDPAGFALVAAVLAEGVVPFIETVERVCER